MNIAATLSLSFGGVGSGCRGSNCGRKKGYGFIGNLDNEKVKGLAQIPEDPDSPGTKMTSFWVAPNGDVYREADLLGPGFHEHFEHALALLQKDPKEFDWIKRASDSATKKEKGFGWKYAFVNNVMREGGIRAYIAIGSKAHWDAGVQVGELNEKAVSRIRSLVEGLPTDSFNVDWFDKNTGSLKGVEGSGKEVMREVNKAFYQNRKG